jgi:uncharacterized repeat protein (TIGR01451 family)
VAVGGSNRVYFLDGNGNLVWYYSTDYPIIDISMTADAAEIIAGGCAGYWGGGAVYCLNKQGELQWSISGVISSVSVSPEGKYLAVTYDGGLGWVDRVALWGDDENKWIWYRSIGRTETGAVAVSADGDYVASGAAIDVFGDGGKLQLRNKAGVLLWEYQIDTGTLDGGKYAVSMSAGGKYIVTGNAEKDYLYFFDRDAGLVWSYRTGRVKGVSITEDGTRMVAAAENVIYLFDNHMNLLWSLNIDKLQDAAISGDGTMIVAVTKDKLVYAFSSRPVGTPKFLALPFGDSDIKIQQGWRYTAPIGPNPADRYAHEGIDFIKGIINQPATWQSFDVLAAADGVAMHSSGGGYGDFVLVRHNQTDPERRNYLTLYGHLANVEDSIVYRADRFATDYENWTPVTRGQKIGVAGSTGVSDPSWVHLHFEVQRGGYAQNKVDPYDIYNTRYYYPGGGMYAGCGPQCLWLEGICPPSQQSGDGARFVADVTIPDGTKLQPGEEFTKTWRLRNTGTTTWTTDYRLVFNGGDQMGAPQYVNLPVAVPPSATVDISVPMTAPESGGAKRGYWRMENSAGLKFGDTIWVDIFVPYTPSPELQAAIDDLYNVSVEVLEELKTQMTTTAEHGDFFRGQVDAAKAATALTLVLGIWGVSSAVNDYLREISIADVRSGLYIARPSIDIWSATGQTYRAYLRNQYDVARFLVNLQWSNFLETDLPYLTTDILNGGLKFYAAAFENKALEEMGTFLVTKAFEEAAENKAVFSGRMYPALASAITMAELELAERRRTLLDSLPSLSPEEQLAYAADLTARKQAARWLYLTSTNEVTNLSSIRGFYEQGWLERIALALLKIVAKCVSNALDGPGRIFVEGFLTAFELYQNQFRLDESQRMVQLAQSLMGRGVDTAQQLLDNAAGAILRVEDTAPAEPVTGQIESISHYSKGYDPWWRGWVETGSYSVIRIANTSPEPADFRVVVMYPVDYEAIFGFSTVLADSSEEVVRDVPPKEAVDVRVNYKRESAGKSPASGLPMYVCLFGANPTGIFCAGTNATYWVPQRVVEGASQIAFGSATAQNGGEIKAIDNPVDVFLMASPEDMSYEVQIWVTNPLDEHILATVSQNVSDDWEIISAPGAQSPEASPLVWQLEMEPGDLQRLSFTFAYHADLASDIVVPSPIVAVNTTDEGYLGDLIGNSPSLKPILPVTGSVSLPVEVMLGEQATVSVSLRNLSSNTTTDGTVNVCVTDPSGTMAYNHTQAFSISPSRNETLEYLLPPFSEKGLYQVSTEISHGGVTRPISYDVLRVGTLALDVSLNATPVDRAYPGDTIVYTVSLNNTSDVALNNVTVEAIVPEGVLAHDISDDGQLEDSVVRWQLPALLLPEQTIELSFQASVLLDAVGPDEARPIICSATAASDEAFPASSNSVRILLVGRPAPVMGTIVGNADLYGEADDSGVLVTVSGEYATTTASNGEFAIYVPGGSYNVTFTHPGFNSVVHDNVVVIPGEEVTLPPMQLIPEQTQLLLRTGWNMLSLSRTPQTADRDAILPDAEVVYTWNPQMKAYESPSEIVPGKGYWALVFSDVSLPLSGTPVARYDLSGGPGWHMIGGLSVGARIVVNSGDLYATLYHWDPQTLGYVGRSLNDLRPGEGYWLLAFTDFSISVIPK